MIETRPLPNAATAPPAALQINNIRFTYPAQRRQAAREALRGVDLSIPAGQAVAMLGPNGSGKSTLMKLICGLLPIPPGNGRIAVFGSNELAAVRRSLGVVFQAEGLDRHMTVFENLRDQARLYGIAADDAKAIIDAELSRANLFDRRNALVKTLSKGLARRVDLIRAMLHKPRVLLLDEPTVGLDPVARERFLEHLRHQQHQQQLTILLSTHLVDEADRHDRVLLMHQGQIIADDTPANLRQRAGARRVTVLDSAWRPSSQFEKFGEWKPSATGAGWYIVLGDSSENARHIAVELSDAGIPFSIAPPTLADVFEQLTGASLDDNVRDVPVAMKEAAT